MQIPKPSANSARTPLTVTIITANEEAVLPTTLKSVQWADEILVIDSGSQDRTVEIAKNLGARVIENPWPGYGQQKNFAQRHASHDWILNIDADEVISPELAHEIQGRLSQIGTPGSTHPVQGFVIPRKTFYLGRWIRHGGWYPNYLCRLANRKSAQWTEPAVHEELRVEGEMGKLESPILHYAFSRIEDQILTNLRFSRLGSEDLRRRNTTPSLLKLFLKPLGKFIETYWIKCGFLDGLPGLIISVNASHSMFLKYAYLFEDRIRK